ncbi:MAG: hypothetical protein J6T06_12620, partial [Victivallales bacterium]|nr:hypothetical protein [Victivallales bacterium]
PGGEASVYSVLLLFIFLFFRKEFLQCIELSHDAVPASRSDDNRRAAGAVAFSAFRFHYKQLKSSGDCWPGGEASVYSVYSVEFL